MQKINDGSITLIEETHTYKLKDDPEFEFTSCTGFVQYFFKPFDRIGIANNLTESHPNYQHLTSQELVEEWDKTALEGTLVHSEIENFILKEETPSHPKSKIAVAWIKKNILEKNRYDIFPEVIIYSKELALAGMIDLLLYDRETNSYKLLDWKTSRKIETKSFNNKTGNHKATSNLMDCNHVHYSIQISLYRYILEKEYGLNVSDTAILHLKDDDGILYTTKYYKNVIEEMLKADRDRLKLKAEESLTRDFI
ncbi:MAG: hypothetical protein CVV24_08975 [Ignavibacteriae bacterium HGW-Ignavibacteriae-3]|nr:MAG: hypothetical protein CVV24_08975 [Ignavibacteriae bacterium HGW-Ignavibacteriae-3]